MVTLTCSHCNQTYETTENTHKVGLWRGQTQFYCSPKCVGLAQRVPAVGMTCDECGKPFTRQASANKVSKSGLRFCSRQCSIVNRGLQRRLSKASHPTPPRPVPTCPTCACPIRVLASGRRRCLTCLPLQRQFLVANRTKGDLFATRANWQSARAGIQKMARAVFFRAIPHPSCGAIETTGRCGYTKHVEVAHRRDVADFPDSALVSEINDLSNLVALCPIHHWEFDNGEFDGLL